MTSKIGSLNEYSILVTGACGFLGSRVVKALLDLGAFVVGNDIQTRLPGPIAKKIKKNSFCFVSGDFLQKSDELLSHLKSEKRGETALFHMAGLAHAGECAKDPTKAFESHISLTFSALEFCRRNKINKFVFPSTGLVYGDFSRQPVSEEALPSPPNIYASLKLSAEALIKGYATNFGMTCLIVRLGNVYGPGGDEDTVVSTIAKQTKAGKRIDVRDLRPIRDFIYVDDVIEGLMQIFLSIDRQECYVVNLSTGIGTSVLDLVKMASRLTAVPFNGVQPHGDSEPTISTLVLDNSLLLKMTGWKPRYALSEGLAKTLINDDQRNTF